MKLYGKGEGRGILQYQKGSALRDLFEECENNAIIKARAIVTANGTTWLSRPIANLKEDQVEIDGVVYFVGNTLAQSYLGMEVD